ncbi:MAG: prefoldin subunit alpha [Candidatus Aenigmarchaeota archaeon]|nr:prefoldin subunit alpha [Candidatus Aenigmarchaeota archaeon]
MDTDAQRKLMYEFEQYSRELQALNEEKNRFSMKRLEIEGAKNALTELSKSEKSADAMVPLGAGVFIKGVVSDTKSAVVSVGAEIAVQKNIPDAKTFLREQITNIDKATVNLNQRIAMVDKEARRISQELEKSGSQARSEQ